MAELIRVKRHRARQEVTEVAQSMPKGEQSFWGKRLGTRQKAGIVVSGKRAPGHAKNGRVVWRKSGTRRNKREKSSWWEIDNRLDKKRECWLRGNSRKWENEGADFLGKMSPERPKSVNNCAEKKGAVSDENGWSWLMENSKKQEKDKVEFFGRKQLVMDKRRRSCIVENSCGPDQNRARIVGRKRHQVVGKMAELFRVKRHRARQEVTEVGLGKTTIRQTNWGAGERLGRRQKSGIVAQGKRAPGRTNNGRTDKKGQCSVWRNSRKCENDGGDSLGKVTADRTKGCIIVEEQTALSRIKIGGHG
ncbi:hypothetical protein T10_1621 [Trichinella papuae]|uniref:Uncharacterized protein n=1 Tax=Trichinella papuae TaxID=268474 RepID=A0A0V1M4P8_9BILA|nr:hypothetical protein T10_1621 [Trichinella papuae]